jgi:hypothetical protein
MAKIHEIKLGEGRGLFDQVPQYIREDLVEAANWARKTLTEKEGSGHQICVTAGTKGGVVCSFAKSSWAGDHSGSETDEAAEAIVISVCEYLVWL